jgi:hypothetical protein
MRKACPGFLSRVSLWGLGLRRFSEICGWPSSRGGAGRIWHPVWPGRRGLSPKTVEGSSTALLAAFAEGLDEALVILRVSAFVTTHSALPWIDVTALLAFFVAGSPLVKVVFRRDQHYRIRTSRLISSVPLVSCL